MSKIEFDRKKRIVNEAIRICVNCGSSRVFIDNNGIYCKDCKSTFHREQPDLQRRIS